MSLRTNPSQSRADEVWKRFVGMFGGESVSRRFGDSPPAEWLGVLGQLKDYELERGMRRLVRSGKASVPSLPEFSRLCRKLDDDTDDPARPALPKPEAFAGDEWTVSANKHLLAHITRAMMEKPHRYGRGPSLNLMRAPEEHVRKLGLDMHNLDASAQFVAAVGKLVAYKNAWARDMREWNGKPTDAEQRKAWDDCMARAEAEIAA